MHLIMQYLCNICEYIAHDKSGLRYHQNTMHWEAIFECPICNHRLTSEQSLNKHKQTNHKKLKKKKVGDVLTRFLDFNTYMNYALPLLR